MKKKVNWDNVLIIALCAATFLIFVLPNILKALGK